MSITRSQYFTFFIAVALVIVLSADTAFAQTSNCGTGSGKLCNPVQFPGIMEFVQGILKVIVLIGIPVISFFIVYSGFLFVKARGGESDLKAAKENLLYVLIGAVLILGAWVIATLIGQTVGDLLR